MNLSSRNLKLIIGVFYLLILFFGLYYLFSIVNLKDFTSYEFIRLNKEIIIEYKNNNFLLLTISFFIFSIIWYLLLGFAGPILLFAGFVFGKWFGIIIAVTSASVGSTLLYLLAKLFFTDLIKEKLEPKYSQLKVSFQKNEFLYFTLFRFAGGGGIPYGIQNVLPVLFNISSKNYFFGTLLGSWPTMFITVALGSGIEKYIDANDKISFFKIISSPDIYLPLLGFALMLIVGLVIKKLFFKKN